VVDLMEMPTRCGIMDDMAADPEIRARLMKAGRNYSRAKDQFEAARKTLVSEIVAARKAGTLIEDIAADVPYRQTQVNRVLEAAGLTEKRAKPEP
jgi:hypothetical protein